MKNVLNHIAVWSLLAACGESSFSGDSKPVARSSNQSPVSAPTSAPTPTSAPVPSSSGTPTPPKRMPSSCSLAADLLTPSIKNNSMNMVFEYEIYLVNCAGAYSFLNQEVIKHDVNMQVPNKAVEYTVSKMDGTQVIRGIFTLVNGSDLFGTVGAGYGHFVTEPLRLQESVDRLKLTIRYPQQVFIPGGSLNAPQTETWTKTYLGFGKAAPVEKQVLILP